MKRPLPWFLLASIMLGNGGLFSWYSYVNPIMVNISKFPPHSMAWIMALSGLGMVMGNYISGRLSTFISPVTLSALMIGLMFVASVLMFFAAAYSYLALALMFIGVFGLFGVSGPEQFLIIDTSEGGGEILGASSAQVAFNLGNALGAFFGGLPMELGYSVEYSALPGCVLSLAGLITIFYFGKYYRPQPDGHPVSQKV